MSLFEFSILMCAAAITGLIIVYGLTVLPDDNKIEAQKIIEFRNIDHTCVELVNMYLKYYPTRYISYTDLNWYWETEEKMVSQDCITKEKLRNLEFIEVCMNGSSIGCEMSKLENPELYENFNFKRAIKEQVGDINE